MNLKKSMVLATLLLTSCGGNNGVTAISETSNNSTLASVIDNTKYVGTYKLSKY